jgi:hypothetical protein
MYWSIDSEFQEIGFLVRNSTEKFNETWVSGRKNPISVLALVVYQELFWGF